MSRDRRKDAATMTVGLTGLGAAGAMRHNALARAHGEYGKNPIPRKKLLAERRLLKHPKGRKTWLAGNALGLVSLPAAAVGANRTFSKRDRDEKGFWRSGLEGARESVLDRTNTVREKPPAKLVAGNYAAGAAVGAGAGGIINTTLRRRLPGTPRAALASSAGALAGVATLPIQSKLTQRASRGQYVVTPTGVRRAKRKPAKPSSKASVYDGRSDLQRFRTETEVGKMSPREAVRLAGSKYNEVGARAGAHWTVNGLRVADRIDYPSRQVPKTRKGKLAYTGRTKGANLVRSVALNAGDMVGGAETRMNAVRNTIHGNPRITEGVVRLRKASSDPGAHMSRAERRARMTASGPPIPVVGDIMQARTAGKYSAEPYRRRTAVENYASGQLGGLAGNAAGGLGAAAIASRSKTFNRWAGKTNQRIEDTTNAARARVGMKPSSGESMTSRAVNHPKAPERLRRAGARVANSSAGRLVRRYPAPAAVGGLLGGIVTGQAATQAAYSRSMTRDDRYRASLKKSEPRKLTPEEQARLRRVKQRSSALSYAGGGIGLSALGASLGASALKRPKVAGAVRRTGANPKKARRALQNAQVPLLTVASGIGGYNALQYANIQRREAQSVGKAFRVPRPRLLGVRTRQPAMRRGTIRQRRYPSGMIRVSTVRGGLS